MEINNLTENRNIISSVIRGSIADELGVEPGDILLSINDQQVNDIIDYKYLITDDFIVVAIQKKDEEVWELEIEKDFDEDIGIIFTNPLIDRAKNCRNKCIFCFIDQLPKGMRESLYFKDDDSRLSFLQGNFITLTNLSEEEVERIIKYRLSPINISVHTTDPDLRIRMLNNKNAGKVYDILKRFSEAGIHMNCQIVLVPGVNDGEQLEKTFNDLVNLYPNVSSVAVVPVGVTKYREKLFDLKIYDHDKANNIIKYVQDKQKFFIEKIGTRFVFASDEFYLLAGKDTPMYDEYEGFPQIENGVGLVRSFDTEVIDALASIGDNVTMNKSYLIATGTLAYDFINGLAQKIMEKIKGLNLKVVPITNNFFGETITVSGLITATDLENQLRKYELKDGIIIPKSMLKRDEDIFLDNVTLKELEERLNTKVLVSEVEGKEFINLLESEKR
ncbi:DUF512 domain-containing protein [Brassicibacter mesophilus]|uniref:DUF512 domain-containing protein n=1 Tax=Brassicibacter mesophilus TaxID=745119 RepID=UPI003D1DF78C